MALRIHCSRSKIFMAPGSTADRHGARKFMIAAGQTVAAPSWLRETSTYKDGVKDGSVLDLTPPTAPVAAAATTAAPAAPEPEPEPAAPVAETAPAEELSPEEAEDRALEEANAAKLPQAQRAPKGVVRASAKKAQ